jgi:hypothetical protein
VIGWGQIVYGAVLSAVVAAFLIAISRGRSRAGPLSERTKA